MFALPASWGEFAVAGRFAFSRPRGHRVRHQAEDKHPRTARAVPLAIPRQKTNDRHIGCCFEVGWLFSLRLIAISRESGV